jgi:hypothetical protein
VSFLSSNKKNIIHCVQENTPDSPNSMHWWLEGAHKIWHNTDRKYLSNTQFCGSRHDLFLTLGHCMRMQATTFIKRTCSTHFCHKSAQATVAGGGEDKKYILIYFMTTHILIVEEMATP